MKKIPIQVSILTAPVRAVRALVVRTDFDTKAWSVRLGKVQP